MESFEYRKGWFSYYKYTKTISESVISLIKEIDLYSKNTKRVVEQFYWSKIAIKYKSILFKLKKVNLPFMKILLVDNYDSFTFNLFHILQNKASELHVVRNDKIDFNRVNQYDKIVLSPGPGLPSESSLLKPLIENFASKKSILGICLGHQAIGEVFDCKLLKMSKVKHGVSSVLSFYDKSDYIFRGLKD